MPKHAKKSKPPPRATVPLALTVVRRPETPPAPQGDGHADTRRTASDEEVRLRAYLKWEAAGRPPGDGADFWLAAERELRGR
jgi:hypothetical protein